MQLLLFEPKWISYHTISMYSFTAYCIFMLLVSNVKINGFSDHYSYVGAQVWRIKLNGERNLPYLTKMVEDRVISMWNLGHKTADFLVRPEHKVHVNRALMAMNLNHSVLIMDVQRRIDDNGVEPALWDEDSLRIGHRLNWKAYPTLKVIDEYLHYVSENFPSISSVVSLGYTFENRSIKMVKISNGNPENKALLIIAGMHAQEWIGITSALYVVDSIVTKYDQLAMLKNVDFLIVPVLNPDGYEYTHTKDRLWRKNRRRLGKTNCYGVDVNRNFDFDLNVSRPDKDNCYDGYLGLHPFSEAESIALQNLILKDPKKPLAVLDLHSYGQQIIYPGSAIVTTSDQKVLWTCAKTISESFKNNGKIYTYGAIHQYPATSTAVNWLFHSGIDLAFSIELPDEGEYGFLLPAENIEPIGQEVLNALNDMLKALDPSLIRKDGVIDSWF